MIQGTARHLKTPHNPGQDGRSPAESASLPWGQWLNVTQLNEKIRDLLEDGFPFVRVQGEISDLRQPPSGHLYFTLMDGQSRVRAVVWRTTRQRMRMRPSSGDAVRVTGRMAVYPPRGEYQLVVEGMQPGGAGTERERFLQIHARLKAEGLFEAGRKKALPFLPEMIGVVTSASGAAIHDIIRVLDNRFPGYHLLLAHAQVQGKEAEQEIVRALRGLIDDGRSDVIICGRGGGSSEDLAAFNSEVVIRAMAASPIPVVSAVGHEVDVTLADLVADARAPTPSAAAEQVMPEKRELMANLEGLRKRLWHAARLMIQRQRHAVVLVEQRLIHPRRKIEFFRVRCDELSHRLFSAEHHFLARRRQRVTDVTHRLSAWSRGPTLGLFHARLAHLHDGLERAMRKHVARCWEKHAGLHARLTSVSPLAVLQRGYAIVYDQRGHVSWRVSTLQTGENLRVVLAQGELEAVITKLKEK